MGKRTRCSIYEGGLHAPDGSHVVVVVVVGMGSRRIDSSEWTEIHQSC